MLILFLFIWEILGLDVVDVSLDGARYLFMEPEIPAKKPGLEFRSNTQQIMHDQNLTIAIFAGADANGRDMQAFGNFFAERGGDLFQHPR
jgi:hypothetical protein